MKTIDELIQYEDEAVIVVRKPAGLAVETKRVTETDLESLLRRHLAESAEKTAELYVVHRLDQRVEGLLVFAKNRKAAGDLSAQLTDGRMQKIYLAKVEGSIPKEADVLTDYLMKDTRTGSAVVIPDAEVKRQHGKQRPKKAVLSYRKCGDSLLEIQLETGRFHQIRAQLSHAGMPIAGDGKYGAETGGQLCLAAVRLTFIHPVSKKRMKFQTEPSF